MRNTAGVHDYASAREYLARGRNKTLRPLPGKATHLAALENGRIVVVYHGTPIVGYSSDGSVSLRFGGFHTLTTREKMRAYTGRMVAGAGRGLSEVEGVVVRETCTIAPDGTVIPDVDDAGVKAIRQHHDRIKMFARDFARAFLAGEVPPPSGGDCWYCHLFGDAGGADHLREYIKEKYYVPSLLVNAAQGDQILLGSVLPDVWSRKRYGHTRFWEGKVRKALQDYIEARLPAP